ncbi:DsbA family protein [Mycetocola saprophilus]|uniref:DsbA family protein n=1 Tax=Mycetocola saprophilus TaxID=76636 RepID=UPI00068D184B|nr:thioredoxin domain-containing protein [Mycetocola saprophilus]
MASSDSGNDPDKMSKKDRREHMREVARLRREEELKRKKRNRIITQIGVVVGSLAVIALVVAIVVNTTAQNNRPGPANMQSGGISFTGAAGKIEAKTTPALKAGDKPVGVKQDSAKTNVVMYVDYLCPLCNQFETANLDGLKDMVSAGTVDLQIIPISILDRVSAGTQYSTRSAAAMACVANYEPNGFLDASAALYAKQPEEGQPGLKNAEIAQVIRDAGVKSNKIESCINDGDYKNFVTSITDQAKAGPLPNTDVPQVTGTPTILVDGKQYTPTQNVGWGNTQDFFKFVEQVQAQNKK